MGGLKLKPVSRLVEMSGNMYDFSTAVTGKKGKFYVEIMGVLNPNESQEKGLNGMLQLGLRYYDSLTKIDTLVDPIEGLTGKINSISRAKGAEPSENWEKCPEDSPYSFSNTFFWK